MDPRYPQGVWEAAFDRGAWEVRAASGEVIALVRSGNAAADARLVAASLCMLEALMALVALIGDEDLPDNGQVSGAAVCDMVRAAIDVATSGERWA